jgi:hypothetical protein
MSELLSALEALPKRALLGGSPDDRRLWSAAQQLAADSFDAGPRPELRFDLIVAPAAALQVASLSAWIAAVCSSSRAALIAWPHRRQSELQQALPEARVLARVRGGMALAANAEPDHDLLLLRGDLRFPLIRVDDYPTGVRPLPSDMSPIHRVLITFEERSLPYCLGIVPGILNDAMFDFLAGLRCMSPAQHGYDHAYPRMSARLLRKHDPWNERATVGAFNEFRFQGYTSIERKLRAGKQLLEARLAMPVTTYIPPCNRCDRSTARALAALGFKLCLSDRPVPGEHLPVLASDFYGRSIDGPVRSEMEVLCLHTNWEWDLGRAGHGDALPKFLDEVIQLTATKELAISRLARYLNDSV